MSAFPLLEHAERTPMVDTSLEAFEAIRPTLTRRELAVFRSVWAWQEWLGAIGVTGGELADFMRIPVTSVRPRLTGLLQKGLVEKTPARASMVSGEGRCHGYRAVVPLAAVERAR